MIQKNILRTSFDHNYDQKHTGQTAKNVLSYYDLDLNLKGHYQTEPNPTKNYDPEPNFPTPE